MSVKTKDKVGITEDCEFCGKELKEGINFTRKRPITCLRCKWILKKTEKSYTENTTRELSEELASFDAIACPTCRSTDKEEFQELEDTETAFCMCCDCGEVWVEDLKNIGLSVVCS